MHRKLEKMTYLLNDMQIAKYANNLGKTMVFKGCAFIRAIGVLVKTCTSVPRKHY